MSNVAQLYELCLEIEKLPASEQQTKVSVLASKLCDEAKVAETILGKNDDCYYKFRDAVEDIANEAYNRDSRETILSIANKLFDLLEKPMYDYGKDEDVEEQK